MCHRLYVAALVNAAAFRQADEPDICRPEQQQNYQIQWPALYRELYLLKYPAVSRSTESIGRRPLKGGQTLVCLAQALHERGVQWKFRAVCEHSFLAISNFVRSTIDFLEEKLELVTAPLIHVWFRGPSLLVLDASFGLSLRRSANQSTPFYAPFCWLFDG